MGNVKSKINVLMDKYTQSRDPKLREEIIIESLKKIKHFINKYYPDYIDKEEMEFKALESAIKLVDRYDSSYSVVFSTALIHSTTFICKSCVIEQEKHELPDINSFVIDRDQIERYIILKNVINKAFNSVNSRDKEIFLLYLKGYDSNDLALMYNCSRQNISQHLVKVKDFIKFELNSAFKEKPKENAYVINEEWAKELKSSSFLHFYHNTDQEEQVFLKIAGSKKEKEILSWKLRDIKKSRLYNYLINYMTYKEALIISYSLCYNHEIVSLCNLLGENYETIAEKYQNAKYIALSECPKRYF